MTRTALIHAGRDHPESGLLTRQPRRYHNGASVPFAAPIVARLFRRKPPGLVPRQFRRDGAVFIHVPKCAGSALLDAWLGFQTGHVTAYQYRDADPTFFESAYVFTFVREPLARFVSAYDHISTDDLWGYLPDIKRQMDRHGKNVAELAEKLSPESELLAQPWFAPQHSFLEIRGRLAVNRVFKTESFTRDLDIIRGETQIRFRDIAPVNCRGDNTTSTAERLGPAGVANLRRIYARDFTLFGYF